MGPEEDANRVSVHLLKRSALRVICFSPSVVWNLHYLPFNDKISNFSTKDDL